MLFNLLRGSKKGKKLRQVILVTKELVAFKSLKQVFILALILRHFNPKALIRLKIDALGFIIVG